MENNAKPITHQGNLAKLPKALAPLIARPQWAVWRWTQKPDGSWQKPPFMATRPERHASTTDPSTWSDYATALTTVQAKRADGITYILTKDNPFAAVDLDHCRCTITNSIDVWAQNWLDTGRNTYQEVTPSGEGCRIWGFADGEPLNRKFTLEIDGKTIAAELFRCTNKALAITGYALDPAIRELGNINNVIKWGLVWGERRKAAAAEQATSSKGNGFDSSGCRYSIEEIEQIVREGPPAGANRSDVFHAIVGHYVGCGWDLKRILAHLEQHPEGIGSRYLAEGRLGDEIARSAGKYAQTELPLGGNGGWTAKAPPHPEVPPQPDQPPEDELDDPELDDDRDDDDLGEELPKHDPNLPRLYAHGDPDARPIKSWLIKGLIPALGHGLMSGQWGAGKTFVFFDLAASLSTGQPWLGHVVKRQCGVLLIAAEGADEVRLRLDAVVREKCGNMTRAPFRWYETPPLLLQKGAKTLIAMARQAEASLQAEFGLPLGLIGIDTIAACAGYSRAGDEYDNAVGQAVMNVLKAVAQELGCFVLGIDHFGKNLEAGTRGASSKESSADLVLACLGNKELSGSVTNTRLAVRKNRSGRQGQEFPFVLRMVEAPEKDEDGDPITTMVIDWLPAGAAAAEAQSEPDTWAQPRRQDQRTAVLRLKRVLMTILAEQGVDLPISPDGPVVRMVDQERVRKAFYASTPADGTPKQKRQFRYAQFKRALDWAEQERLIAIGEIGDITYIWLTRPDPEDAEEEQG
jgi:AAA domain